MTAVKAPTIATPSDKREEKIKKLSRNNWWLNEGSWGGCKEEIKCQGGTDQSMTATWDTLKCKLSEKYSNFNHQRPKRFPNYTQIVS